MRIVIVGETPAMPTGFGMQTKQICEGLAEKGHEVILLSASVPMKPVPMKHGVREMRFAQIHDMDMLDAQIHTLQPNIVFVFGCTAFVANNLAMRAAPRNVPVLLWLPYEGSSLPAPMVREFRGCPPNAVVHLSEFASRLWESVAPSAIKIPHLVDTEVWKHLPDFGPVDRQKLRRKFAKKFRWPLYDDMFVVLNVDRNIWHKRWDATFDYVRKLQEQMPEKEVVLIAHTRKIQTEEGQHPPGYNLPELETRYGLEGSVFYTEFDWHASLTQEEMVELVRLCDIRVSTSEGEGFGVPTIEVASLGVLQILNEHTTTPELVGRESPMMVAPAMTEDRMLSTWQVPNVAGMARQTLLMLDDEELAQHAVDSARAFVEERFTKEKVIDLFDRIFQGVTADNKPGTLYHGFRWGYRHQFDSGQMFNDLAAVCLRMGTGQRVLEVGSFAGQFVKACAEVGLGITGIENDEVALQGCDERAKMFIALQSFETDWPLADVLVMTDMHDLFHEQGGPEYLKSLYDRVQYYSWAILRHRARFTWGVPSFEPNVCRSWLVDGGMVRRKELEAAFKTKSKTFEHEIWCKTELVDVTPKAIEEMLKDDSN